MEDVDETCNTRLSLGLGMEGYVPLEKKQELGEEEAINNVNHHHPNQKVEEELMCLKKRMNESAGIIGDEKGDDDHIKNSRCRKKLRLTKEQSAMLEDSFKLQTTLNPVQKQELAHQLNLKPRQIEVWFQNRRARKKLKQTEVDCEFLKKCCESLRDENERLKKEVEELRGMKFKVEVEASSSSSPILCNIIQLSNVTTLALCSSCEKPLKPSNTIDEEKKNISINANDDNNISDLY